MKLGFLASGKGSNIKSILQAIDEGRLKAEAKCILSNNFDTLNFAWKYGLSFICLQYDIAIAKYFKRKEVDYVICCGYLQKVGPEMIKAFPGHILNIHPSLLPKHGGKGKYGLKVHQAVLDAQDEYSGATVHVVNSEYDRGRILGQKKVRVFGNDTAEILKQKVFAIEEELYPKVLREIKLLNDIFGEIDH